MDNVKNADQNMLLQEGNNTNEQASKRESRLFTNASKVQVESMDFEEIESVMWRKHQLRRFFQDRGHWWTTTRRTTAWKWVLVITTGVLIGLVGCLVQSFTTYLTNYKFSKSLQYMQKSQSKSFFAFLAFCLFYALLAGLLCFWEPRAAGGGIPEIKAFLNGINLNKFVRIKVLFAKVVGMCLSCSASLPIGKEAPMIHAGAIIGAAVSQGKTITFGFDTSWTKFQDLRNERSKRDFVTFGAAAGVAAAFSAPIGGILFTLEEGASFWSTTLTFRAFFCAMVTQLTIQLVTGGSSLGKSSQGGIFTFGTFTTPDLFAYELLIFTLMGAAGGVMGALFNSINKQVTLFRKKHINTSKVRRLIELLVITGTFACVCFIVPFIWGRCTPIPTDTADWTPYQQSLVGQLVQFNCKENQYNQAASLFFVEAQVAMQQLFHFLEFDGTSYESFDTGALLLFFLSYFFAAAVTAGCFCPAGLFVPTLLSGAAYGRLIGHILNSAVPGRVSDSGTYALIGAAAILGGMSRMTIAGTVIVLEASGNPSLLLPLMLTFAAARYSGNAINLPMYDMHIELNHLPFLEGSLKTLGLLNYHPITEIMAKPVISIGEINRVSKIYDLLKTTQHNGFPVISKNGHLRGMVLRKTLCSLLKLKVYSTPVTAQVSDADGNMRDTIQLTPVAAAFHDTLERSYPNYPKISDIDLTAEDMACWLDIRAYMDTAAYSINESCSIQRAYRFFRTMGLRHLAVVDGDHKVTGILTRHDVTEHRLEHHWFHEGDNLQQFIDVGPSEPLSFTSASIDDGSDGYADMMADTQFSSDAAKNAGNSATSGSRGQNSFEHPSALRTNPIATFDMSTGQDYDVDRASKAQKPRDSRVHKEPKSIKSSK